MDVSVGFAASPGKSSSWRLVAATAVVAFVGVACNSPSKPVFTELLEARRVAADLRVNFNKASDASSRAVMADTDGASVAFAREAEHLKELVRNDVATLYPLLRSHDYSVELKLLEEFGGRFSEYEKLDHDILELAVENTNLKAQRLSFGPAREAVAAFRASLAGLAAHPSGRSGCQLESLSAKAVAAVLEIQVLQAPHIAEANDAVMTGLEKTMAELAATAKEATDALSGLVDAKARPQVAAALVALGRFDEASREIVKLSRRNSNVRSLELSLGPKPPIVAACDERVRFLSDALANEKLSATR